MTTVFQRLGIDRVQKKSSTFLAWTELAWSVGSGGTTFHHETSTTTHPHIILLIWRTQQANGSRKACSLYGSAHLLSLLNKRHTISTMFESCGWKAAPGNSGGDRLGRICKVDGTMRWWQRVDLNTTQNIEFSRMSGSQESEHPSFATSASYSLVLLSLLQLRQFLASHHHPSHHLSMWYTQAQCAYTMPVYLSWFLKHHPSGTSVYNGTGFWFCNESARTRLPDVHGRGQYRLFSFSTSSVVLSASRDNVKKVFSLSTGRENLAITMAPVIRKGRTLDFHPGGRGSLESGSACRSTMVWPWFSFTVSIFSKLPAEISRRRSSFPSIIEMLKLRSAVHENFLPQLIE